MSDQGPGVKQLRRPPRRPFGAASSRRTVKLLAGPDDPPHAPTDHSRHQIRRHRRHAARARRRIDRVDAVGDLAARGRCRGGERSRAHAHAGLAAGRHATRWHAGDRAAAAAEDGPDAGVARCRRSLAAAVRPLDRRCPVPLRCRAAGMEQLARRLDDGACTGGRDPADRGFRRRRRPSRVVDRASAVTLDGHPQPDPDGDDGTGHRKRHRVALRRLPVRAGPGRTPQGRIGEHRDRRPRGADPGHFARRIR